MNDEGMTVEGIIRRLNELKKSSPLGGKTPVIVHIDAVAYDFVTELQLGSEGDRPVVLVKIE